MLDAKLSEIAARWEWMCDLLEGKAVGEFALSFPEVRQLSDLVQQIHQPADSADEAICDCYEPKICSRDYCTQCGRNVRR